MLRQSGGMSADGAMLLLEGFLQKRKDTMKLRWATYWFRLQNTTLFFYTKKNGSALHLKGNYYIYTVQSVREVIQPESERFMFEIIMKNGKRKMLAAETAALRQKWLRHLWYAMKLSASVVAELRSTLCETSEQEKTPTTGTTGTTGTTSTSPAATRAESRPAPPPSTPTSSIAPPTQPACEKAPPPTCPQASDQHGQNPALPVETAQSRAAPPAAHCPLVPGGGPDPGGCVAEVQPEGDYDVLPCRKSGCELQPEAGTEGVYDFPASYWRTIERRDSSENIYDVPSSLLRRLPEQVPSPSQCSLPLDLCPRNDSLN